MNPPNPPPNPDNGGGHGDSHDHSVEECREYVYKQRFLFFFWRYKTKTVCYSRYQNQYTYEIHQRDVSGAALTSVSLRVAALSLVGLLFA